MKRVIAQTQAPDVSMHICMHDASACPDFLYHRFDHRCLMHSLGIALEV